MKCVQTVFLLLCCILCVFMGPITVGYASEEAQLKITSIQAEFVQEKHLKILAKPIISRGTFSFQTPQSLRWEYRMPVPSLLLMHGQKVRKFMQKDGGWREEKGARFDFMQVVMADISNWLEGRFTENEMFEVTFPDKEKVLLIPKSESLQKLISRIELGVADKKGLLQTVKIFEDSSSYTLITFKDRVLNQVIPAHQFTQQ